MVRMCSIEGCGKPHEAKGYCKSHYRKFRQYGDPLAGRTKRPSGPCQVEGCGEAARRWGYCAPHSRQFRTHGDPTVRVRRVRGTGYIRDDGYIQLGQPDHPLADKRGIVYVHRMILFDTIGPGPHKCTWCSITVRWVIGGGPGSTSDPHALVVDHLDFNPSNNDPANLVASCNTCNAQRHQEIRLSSSSRNTPPTTPPTHGVSPCPNTWPATPPVHTDTAAAPATPGTVGATRSARPVTFPAAVASPPSSTSRQSRRA